MAKRWTQKDDEFLVEFSGGGNANAKWLNFIASHDLGHHGKDAGKKRMNKLRETGVLDKIMAARRAQYELNEAWFAAFGHPSLRAEREEMRAFSEAEADGEAA